jgi:NitT/TauT family transport system ATP-binding protein
MRQRVSLCRALIADPSILLMDEPFSALDAITRDDMNIVLLELWERYRKTVLFVTHSIREAVMPRPRGFAIGETSEFNELCGMLRDQITRARQGEAETRH